MVIFHSYVTVYQRVPPSYRLFHRCMWKDQEPRPLGGLDLSRGVSELPLRSIGFSKKRLENMESTKIKFGIFIYFIFPYVSQIGRHFSLHDSELTKNSPKNSPSRSMVFHGIPCYHGQVGAAESPQSSES